MNERRQDFELLQRFTRHGEQSAFADVVRRHLDLVFATALRKVEDAGAAQEVAQNVFTDLARKAWRFAPDDSLPAWLHKAALVESTSWLRGELRRRRREETAAELGTTMKSSADQPAFHALVPLLDEALLSLRETDRTALLLRFYEKHSLRDVGSAFGVSEDTAQKRVQGALEKLTEFFKRRGYKTASVVATAAALKHTAVTASASMVSTIVGVVLPVAPVALTGLAALLARLASLSTVQTAALCVALTAAPAGWQWRQHGRADDEIQRMRVQLLTAQTDGASAQADLERWRADSEKLEQSLAQANEAVGRAAADAQAFADWKQKIRAGLAAADYRWSDESPFVRIPKVILPELSGLIQAPAFSPPGVVNSYERELLGLTPTEQQAIEEMLQRVAELQRGPKVDVYETDSPVSGRTLAGKVFTGDPSGEVGPAAEQRFAQMLADLRGILGEERWPVVPSRYRTVNCDELNRMLIPQPAAYVLASVEIDENGIPQAKWRLTGEAITAGGFTPRAAVPPAVPAAGDKAPPGNVYSVNVTGYVNNNAALSAFLPDADPEQRKKATNFSGIHIPPAVKQRAAAWFEEQAVARSAGKEKP